MTPQERLDNAIKTVKTHGHTPREGKIVAKAYKEGELYNVEECLFVIGELLSQKQ